MRLTDEIRTILEYSRDEALRTGHRAIAPEHLLLGIIRHGSNAAVDFMSRAGLDTKAVKEDIDSRIFRSEGIPYEEQDSITFTRSALNTASMAIMEAMRDGSDICALHLLAALCDNPGDFCGEYLRARGIDIRIIRSYTKKNSADKKKSALPSSEDIDRLLSVFYPGKEIYS